jgi:hypothetical protein
VTVEWEGEGEGEGPDWKTSYSLHVAATDGEQEILAPLVIRDGYHTHNYHPLKNRGESNPPILHIFWFSITSKKSINSINIALMVF